ncbi:MAG TPA: ATP-grasp domain-containing protein [Bacteroidia bacterium]|nr:ATP-grasp domain-containing protein [Bacteroidia bacterium]
MKKRKVVIAVTGLNAIDNPGPGISVIRALKASKRFDCRIIGLSYESLEPGIYMHDLVDKTYQIPLPSAGIESLKTRMAYICSMEHPDVIIPNFDSELFNFIKISDALKSELGIHSFLPTLEQFESRQKNNLQAFGKKHKVTVPLTRILNSLQDIAALKPALNYPLMIKGKFYDASIVYSPDQAAVAFNRIASKWGLPVLAQEFVDGLELNVTALGDGEGNTLGAVAMRKQYVTDKGKAWSGISISDEKLMKLTRQIIKGTRWRGAMELELIKHSEKGYCLLEINPRFPAWVYLAVGCGQNHPEALVQLALGEKVPEFDSYDVGKLFIRYSYDMIVDLKEFEAISTSGEL